MGGLTDVGENVAVTVQLAPGAMLPMQVSTVTVKSPGLVPFRTLLVILSTAALLLVRTLDIDAAVAPTGVSGNVSTGGKTEIPGEAPVPCNVTCCGLPVALFATDKVAK
jgi:hypothetical protein